jgi:exodeoxyribonuclease-3
MRIATWNVNSVKARLKFVLHWLDARKPDLACLQELKVDAEHFPHEVFRERGYHCSLHAQSTWNGVAVISREPATIVQAGLPGAEALGARLVTVECAGLSATSVYVPNGKTVAHEDYQSKLAFMRQLGAYVRGSLDAAGKTLVAGDFNICPSDLDSYAPEYLAGSIFHTDAERSAMAELFGAGYADVYRALQPEGRMFSWWDYRAGCFHKNQGLRIDLLLASQPLLAAIGEVWIDREYRKKKDGATPSDHAPVIAELA